jgi:HK97 family phage major capsid protein
MVTLLYFGDSPRITILSASPLFLFKDTPGNLPIASAALASGSFSIVFGNFKMGYLIVDRIGTRVIRDPFSNKPYIGFYTTKRLGGTVTNSEALKVLKFA